MKFSIRHADKIVGTLVILALAMLVFVIFMLGRNQRWFMHDNQYKTYLDSASAVSRNMPVHYKGFTIGYIKDIQLSEDDRVVVIFTIFEKFVDRVTNGSIVEVQSSPIPGFGNTFSFYFGRGTEKIPEGEFIPEINSTEAKFLIASGMVNHSESGADSISVILNRVKSITETIDISIAGSKGYENLPLGQILKNIENATVSLEPILKDLEFIIAKASDPSETLMSILDSQGTFNSSLESSMLSISDFLDTDGVLITKLESSITSLSGIIENLEKTSEFLPAQLPQIGVLISDLNPILRNMNNVLIAVSNNPLLRKGIPEQAETGPGGASPRDLEF